MTLFITGSPGPTSSLRIPTARPEFQPAPSGGVSGSSGAADLAPSPRAGDAASAGGSVTPRQKTTAEPTEPLRTGRSALAPDSPQIAPLPDPGEDKKPPRARSLIPPTLDGGTTIVHQGVPSDGWSLPLRTVLAWPDRDLDPEQRAREQRTGKRPNLWLLTPPWELGQPGATPKTSYSVNVWADRSGHTRTVNVLIDGYVFARFEPNTGRCSLQLKAQLLWSQGAGADGFRRAAAWAAEAFGEHLGLELDPELVAEHGGAYAASEAGWRVQCLEICQDWASLYFTLDDCRSFVGLKTGHHDSREQLETSHHGGSADRVETIMLGRRTGPKSLVIYNKRAQIEAAKAGDATTYASAWAASGLREDEDITRVELRLNTYSLVIERDDDSERIDLRRLENAGNPELLAKAWRYHLSMLRLVVPESATRRSRCAIDPRWSLILDSADVPADWDPDSWRCCRKPQRESLARSVDLAQRTHARSEARLVELLCPVVELPDDHAGPAVWAAWAEDYDRQREHVAKASRASETLETKRELAERSRNRVAAYRHHVGPELRALAAYWQDRHGPAPLDLRPLPARPWLDPGWREAWLAGGPVELPPVAPVVTEYSEGAPF